MEKHVYIFTACHGFSIFVVVAKALILNPLIRQDMIGTVFSTAETFDYTEMSLFRNPARCITTIRSNPM